MQVFFAPDYRDGVAYQSLLAASLSAENVEVTFPYGHRRVLPLWRAIREWRGDILHLHWPENFFQVRRDGLDFLRSWRYPLDLGLAFRQFPIVLTAHDLRPHNRSGSILKRNFQLTYNAARAIIVHSEKARQAVIREYNPSPDKLHVIPHGDLSSALHPLPERAEARAALGIAPEESLCLMFGTVEPYKGIEPVLDWWRAASPKTTLAIAGKPISNEYAAAIRARAEGGRIRLNLKWQSGEELDRWLASADCVLFHYKAIFTSGAACLARSLGIPILIPHRLETIDLAEPHPLVFRFNSLETDFGATLASGLAAAPSWSAAAEWRKAASWSHIAELTARIYRAIA